MTMHRKDRFFWHLTVLYTFRLDSTPFLVIIAVIDRMYYFSVSRATFIDILKTKISLKL